MSSKQSHPSDNVTSRQAGWSVMQRADDPDIERARFQLKEDIANGATGISLVFEGANSAYGFGLPAKAETIPTLFDGVSLDGLHIRLDNHPHEAAYDVKRTYFFLIVQQLFSAMRRFVSTHCNPQGSPVYSPVLLHLTILQI